MMAPDQSITILPNADVKQFLGSVQGPALKDAKDAKGQFLLGGEFHTDQNAAALANAVNQCMQWVEPLPARGTQRVLTRHGSKPGVWFLPASAAGDLQLLAAPETAQHWQLSFEGSNVIYQTLTQEEAEQLLVEKRASLQAEDEPPPKPWLEEIGDLVQGIIQDIITVTNYIVTTVKDRIHATIIFMVNGVKYLFEKTLALVEEVFDFVESIFAKVKVGFDKLCQWLGFLFNWDDILRTKEALAYTINQLLLFLQGSARGVKVLVDNGIANLKEQIAKEFDKFISALTGQPTIGSYVTNHQQSSPQVSFAMSHNVVFNGFMENVGKAKSPPAVQAAVNPNEFQAFMEQVSKFVSEHGGDFTPLEQVFEEIASTPSRILNTLLVDLLKLVNTVLQAIFTGIQSIVDAILDLVAKLIEFLQNAFNEPWDIPFVSPLYRLITKRRGTLTSLDLITLIIAIPTTIIYKIGHQAPPFPTDADVAAFKNAFNAQSMLRAVGFGNAPREANRKLTSGDGEREILESRRALALDDAGDGGLVPKAIRPILGVAGGFSTILFGVASAKLDGTEDPFPRMHWVAFGLECATQAFLCPWFFASGLPGCDTAEGVRKWKWICEDVGLVIDLISVCREGKMTENAGDTGVMLTCAYGLAHIFLAIFANTDKGDLDRAGSIIPVVPELCKWLLHSQVVKISRRASPRVCGGIDLVCYSAAGVITMIQAFNL